jgi:hypothetical protein
MVLTVLQVVFWERGASEFPLLPSWGDCAEAYESRKGLCSSLTKAHGDHGSGTLHCKICCMSDTALARETRTHSEVKAASTADHIEQPWIHGDWSTSQSNVFDTRSVTHSIAK